MTDDVFVVLFVDFALEESSVGFKGRGDIDDLWRILQSCMTGGNSTPIYHDRRAIEAAHCHETSRLILAMPVAEYHVFVTSRQRNVGVVHL